MTQLPLSVFLVALLSGLSVGQTVTSTDSPPYSYAGLQIEWAVARSPNPRDVAGVLLPLRTEAYSQLPDVGLKGTAVLATTANTSQTVNPGNIVFIQCDPSNTSDPSINFQTAVQRSPVAVVLYSNTSSYCSYTPGNFMNSDFPFIYSMTKNSDYTNLNNTLNSDGSDPMSALIARNTTFAGMSQNNQQQQQQTPGGPSPSTAVAMIILYSITGVITALFLIIIITGAIRAHRHPERYGPRNVLGRPRQSRARGLGRAILDTIPIVKFGEKEEPKPGDVEMNAASGADTTVRGGEDNAAQDTTMTRAATENGEVTADSSPGITAAATPSPEPEAEGENQSCSICTEDFEKGQDVRVLPCKHSYHPACIDPWLLNVSGTCPLCRTDLRPSTSHTSDHLSVSESASIRQPSFAPPLEAEPGEPTGQPGPLSSSRTSRRISAFLDILNPRRMENASPQERIAALRRLREARRATQEDEAETRRRRRLTARFQETFHIRTRSRGSESPPAEAAVPEASPGAEEDAEAEIESRRSNNSVTEARGASPARSNR